MTEAQRALEALYRARDAVHEASSMQAKTRQPLLSELHAFGSAIVSTLAGLGQLSTVLSHQVGTFDEDEVEQAAVSDDPVDKLRVAGMHMSRLDDLLAQAVKDAGRYWTAMESVELHTRSEQ
ncbi:hypothetical protein MOQ72_34810 [Saccharopolyspora sp. K220]|uniref:hypothetical protein n=1 Tax=Saccharopolyspora soli TaxID=2926618 RepID=UPI001F567D78|nr:hypothetical protein [Saccharopolyspora soli]MCI2422613.1 hypothetical protein [Saccharopolyspora soli]